MDPQRIESLLADANRLLETGKPAESLKVLDEIEGEPLDSEQLVEWATLRAWALSELDRSGEALELLAPLVEEHGESSRLLGTLGVVLSNEDRLEEALEVLEQAVALDEEDEVLVANLALVYERLGHVRRAAELYDRALELGADVDWVLVRKAAVLAEMNDTAGAKATLRRYLSLAPDDANQLISLAILHSDDDEFEAAVDCYRRAEAADPNSPSLRLNWGVSAVRGGDLVEARRQLHLLRELEPESNRPELLRAFILEEEHGLGEACAIYDRLLAELRDDDEDEVTYTLEMAMDFFSRQKMVKRCERLLKRAYALNACTVELCEAYREATSEHVNEARWFSVVVEAKYRRGLCEAYAADADPRGPFSRFLRNYQVVAYDRDHAMAMVVEFARRMGETDARVREFLSEEEIEDTHTGVYEVERDSLVFSN